MHGRLSLMRIKPQKVFSEKKYNPSLPADVLWGSFVTHSFLPHGGRNECVTNEPQRTSAGRLVQSWLKLYFLKEICIAFNFSKKMGPYACSLKVL